MDNISIWKVHMDLVYTALDAGFYSLDNEIPIVFLE